MVFNRRQFLFGGAAAVAALSVGTPAFAQAPTVPQQQAYHLYECLLYDRVFKKYDTGQNLRDRYKNTKSDTDRALIISASAMGIEEIVNEAAKEALGRSTLEVDGWQLGTSNYEQVRDKYANKVGTSEIAAIANESLKNAYEGSMTYQQYMEQVFIPFKTSDQGIKNIQTAAIGFGLRTKPRTIPRPGTNTLASLEPNH